MRGAFVAASIAWVLALPLAPLAASRAHVATVWYSFAFAVYAVGGFICHQRPERSFHLWAAQMPVCARCTGIYVGAAVVAAATAFRTARAVRHDSTRMANGLGRVVRQAHHALSMSPLDLARGNPEPVEGSKGVQILLLIAVIPAMATLVYEWTTGMAPSNWIRAAAGFPPGAAVAWIIGGGSIGERR